MSSLLLFWHVIADVSVESYIMFHYQDFEDWDDVGLNIPKPAELLSLYRDFMRQAGNVKSPCEHMACQTEWLAEDMKKDADMQELVCLVTKLSELLQHNLQDRSYIIGKARWW